MRTIQDTHITERRSPLVARAMASLYRQMRTKRRLLDNTQLLYDYVALAMGGSQREKYFVFYVDAQLRLIEGGEMFSGTNRWTQVSPREIARHALKVNAAGVFLAHCHPGGDPAPSIEDKESTWAISEALDLFDVRVLDHLIVADAKVTSFAAQQIALYRPSGLK